MVLTLMKSLETSSTAFSTAASIPRLDFPETSTIFLIVIVLLVRIYQSQLEFQIEQKRKRIGLQPLQVLFGFFGLQTPHFEEKNWGIISPDWAQLFPQLLTFIGLLTQKRPR